jgi:hypothetical protein
MKHLILALIMGLTLSGAAHAYSSNAGADPVNDSPDIETKAIVKSRVSGESSSVSVGHILTYAAINDGYTVTRIGANTPFGTNKIACVADRAIASSDTGYFTCITKGLVNVKYDATIAITAGMKLCSNAEGVAVSCAGPVNGSATLSPAFGSTTANSGIVALETAASGTGTMKAIVNLQ